MVTAKTTEEISADLGREVQELRSDLTALVATVKDLGVTHARATATEIEDLVAKRPISSVLVALCLGYFVAKLRR